MSEEAKLEPLHVGPTLEIGCSRSVAFYRGDRIVFELTAVIPNGDRYGIPALAAFARAMTYFTHHVRSHFDNSVTVPF